MHSATFKKQKKKFLNEKKGKERDERQKYIDT